MLSSVANDSGVSKKMAQFGPESVAHFAPEWVAYFGSEWVAQFGPEYAGFERKIALLLNCICNARF